MTETYSLSADFPNGLLNHLLVEEINNNGTLPTCLGVSSVGDVVTITFSSTLNITQRTTLGVIILAHNGTNKTGLALTTTGPPSTQTILQSTQTSDITVSLPNISTNLVGTNTSDTLTNKQLVDSSTLIVDDANNTKKMKFQISEVSAGSTRTITVPDSDITLVGTSNTQTITNKIIDSTTNTVTSDQLRSATGVIDVKSATAPTTGQVLVATSATSATWQTISSGSNTFGSSYNYVSQKSESTTNSTTPVVKATFTSNIPAGKYHIGCSYEVSGSFSLVGEVTLDVAGTRLLTHQSNVLTTYAPNSAFFVEDLAGGSTTCTLSYRTTNILGTMKIKNVVVELWRVS